MSRGKKIKLSVKHRNAYSSIFCGVMTSNTIFTIIHLNIYNECYSVPGGCCFGQVSYKGTFLGQKRENLNMALNIKFFEVV